MESHTSYVREGSRALWPDKRSQHLYHGTRKWYYSHKPHITYLVLSSEVSDLQFIVYLILNLYYFKSNMPEYFRLII